MNKNTSTIMDHCANREHPMNGQSNGSVTNGQGEHATGAKEDFLENVFRILVKEGIQQGTDVTGKVVDFHHPKDLKKKLDLELKMDGDSDDRLLELIRSTIKYSVKTGHPHFFNQLYQGQDLYGLTGAWLTETLNTSQYTFEVAPVFTLMEEAVLNKVIELLGFPEEGEGIFCPGGSISNMYGLNLARFHKFPQVKTDGLYGLPRLTIFTSEESHYSILKGAALLGMGTNNVIKVRTNNVGKMCPQALEEAIQESKKQGAEPICIVATGGTTVVGSYDPIPELADVAAKYSLWLHVDMIWGGGALLSPKHRHLLQGVERADSVAWNPHKMMGAPLQCSTFITRHKGLLEQAHSAKATYLFQSDKFYDTRYDTGDRSVQCGRKVDVFKLWLMWRAYGLSGLAGHIENLFENANYLKEKLLSTAGFRLVFPKPECTNVCFWYIPPSMREQEETEEWWQRLHKVAPTIKERMMVAGSVLIGYQPLGSKVNFFRMVLANHEVKHEHMDFCVEEIHRLGQDL